MEGNLSQPTPCHYLSSGVSLQSSREDHVTYFLYILLLFFALLQFPVKLFQCVMAKEQDSPCQRENSSGGAKFAYALSFLSVLICSAVLVRVEIVNQRVDSVENVQPCRNTQAEC